MCMRAVILILVSFCLSGLSFSQSRHEMNRIHYRVDCQGKGRIRLIFTDDQNEPLKGAKVYVRALEWAPDRRSPANQETIRMPFRHLASGRLGEAGDCEFSMKGLPFLPVDGGSIQVWLGMSGRKVLLILPDFADPEKLHSMNFTWGRYECVSGPEASLHLNHARLATVQTRDGAIPDGLLNIKLASNTEGYLRTHFDVAGVGLIDSFTFENDLGLKATWNGRLFIPLTNELARATLRFPSLTKGSIRIRKPSEARSPENEPPLQRLSFEQVFPRLSCTLEQEKSVSSKSACELLWDPKGKIRIDLRSSMANPHTLELTDVNAENGEIALSRTLLEKVHLKGVINDKRIRIELTTRKHEESNGVTLYRNYGLEDAKKIKFIYLESPSSTALLPSPFGRKPLPSKSFNRPVFLKRREPTKKPFGWQLDLSEFSDSLPSRMYRRVELSLKSRTGAPLMNEWVHFGGGPKAVSKGFILTDSAGKAVLHVSPWMTELPVRVSAGTKVSVNPSSGLKVKYLDSE